MLAKSVGKLSNTTRYVATIPFQYNINPDPKGELRGLYRANTKVKTMNLAPLI